MFIHPMADTTKTIVTLVDSECVQPNAIDLRISHLYQLSENSSPAIIGRSGNRSFEVTRVVPVHRLSHEQSGITLVQCNAPTDVGVFELLPHTTYQFDTQHVVEIGEGEVGWLVHRSSLARNGVFVTSGVYDAGFRGVIGGVIYNTSSKPVYIERGARVAQLLLAKSESVKNYNGQYQDQGTTT